MGDYQYPTDPYGYLEYAVGIKRHENFDGSDMICFDFAEVDHGKMVLHAVINVDTCHFIEDVKKITVPKNEAPREALDMCRNALEWVYSDGDEVDIEGWNQDPFYFYRVVKNMVEGGNEEIPRIRKCKCGKKKQRPHWVRGILRGLCVPCATADPEE